jgi:hypothetical protein
MGPMLEAGEPYRITVEGTYSVWDLSTTTVELCKGDDESSPMFPSPGRVNGPVLFDARYQFAVLSWDPACDAETDTPFVSGGFRVSLDGGATFVILVPEGADGFDPGHLYTYDVTWGRRGRSLPDRRFGRQRQLRRAEDRGPWLRVTLWESSRCGISCAHERHRVDRGSSPEPCRGTSIRGAAAWRGLGS